MLHNDLRSVSGILRQFRCLLFLGVTMTLRPEVRNSDAVFIDTPLRLGASRENTTKDQSANNYRKIKGADVYLEE